MAYSWSKAAELTLKLRIAYFKEQPETCDMVNWPNGQDVIKNIDDFLPSILQTNQDKKICTYLLKI